MPPPKIAHVHRWTCELVRNHPHCLFVFGDNLLGRGCGGQAVIRFCSNAIGIPTKKYPNMAEGSFFTDTEFVSNVLILNEAIDKLRRRAATYQVVVFPSDGLGTGLAELNQRAPRTFAYLNKCIADLQQEWTRSSDPQATAKAKIETAKKVE